MAIFSLYPSFIKLTYSSNSHPHVQVLPVWAQQAGVLWNLRPVEGAVDQLWTAFVDAYVAAVKPLFPVTAAFNGAQLWTLGSSTADPVLRAIYNIAVVGTNAQPSTPFVEARYTYRTHKGGLLMVQLMESSHAANLRDAPPLVGAQDATFSASVLADTNCIFGRDGGRPLSLVSLETKVNDKLRKKYIATV